MLALFLLLTACGGAVANDESVRTHFSEVPGFTAHIKILSNLGQSVLEYELDYVYNKEDSDSFTVTAPASLSGISGTIAGTDSAQFSLQYDGAALDDAMPQRIGLTPADGLFCLLSDLRSDVPAEQWSEDVAGQTLLVLRYESDSADGKIVKQVWLTEDGRQPVCAELYADDTCVLTIQVMEYQEKT